MALRFKMRCCQADSIDEMNYAVALPPRSSFDISPQKGILTHTRLYRSFFPHHEETAELPIPVNHGEGDLLHRSQKKGSQNVV